MVSFHPTQPRLPIKQPNYASTEDSFHTFCARYLIRSNKVDGNALHLHLVRKVRKVPFRNLSQMDGSVACLLSRTCQLSPLSSRLSITHTHTQSPDRAAAAMMTLLSFTAAASPLCTVDQLGYPPRHRLRRRHMPLTHSRVRRKWHPSFSLPLQPLPNYHGTESCHKKPIVAARKQDSSQNL